MDGGSGGWMVERVVGGWMMGEESGCWEWRVDNRSRGIDGGDMRGGWLGGIR